jgi:hypothetical protein
MNLRGFVRLRAGGAYHSRRAYHSIASAQIGIAPEGVSKRFGEAYIHLSLDRLRNNSKGKWKAKATR